MVNYNGLIVATRKFDVLKDVRAHCYCTPLVRTLFIRHARATSFSSGCTKSKTQQNIELTTFALTWCANIFVGCSVTPTFFSADHFLFWFFPLYQKTRNTSWILPGPLLPEKPKAYTSMRKVVYINKFVAGYENLFYLKCSSEKKRLNTNVKRENDICLCTHFR